MGAWQAAALLKGVMFMHLHAVGGFELHLLDALLCMHDCWSAPQALCPVSLPITCCGLHVC